jgi:hypothetical protein
MKVIVNDEKDQQLLMKIRELLEPLKNEINSISIDCADVTFRVKPKEYVQLKKAELTPDNYGNKITISMVGLYDNSGKWIKWTKINDNLLNVLMNQKIPV